MFKKRFFNNVMINGKTIQCSGSSVIISNGNVIVDGEIICENIGHNAKITVNGDVNELQCSGSVEVSGNTGSIECGGSCKVSGDVNGNIDCGGSVDCGNVSGDIDAGGNVKCRR